MRELSHQLAARLSYIDNDRDMAVLAFAEGAEEVLGVARFSADPDDRIAEFAIAVRSDRKGHGLGYLLMARLIQLVRQRGIDGLVGEVLPENVAMLQLCRAFGFTITIDPRDPTLRLASKTLQDQGYCRRSDEVDSRTVASVRYLSIPLVAAEGWLE